ncbi:unnamed protein product [Tuber melanosporum]|uniref:(Perigord truffle) hypothetical protein n=1 Tax=Tuber melanosporum (strain Mel28) TaxID=656061 RepID=D5GNW2_TUBMM|nr:uncharacterized protein GSTUM_00011541001 [Tuber melanosporum]CAZ86205.1 unnamed protein product [Tuber melanosporum]
MMVFRQVTYFTTLFFSFLFSFSRLIPLAGIYPLQIGRKQNFT